jgi:hypothetical protein
MIVGWGLISPFYGGCELQGIGNRYREKPALLR